MMHMYRMLIVDDEELIVNSLGGYISEYFEFELHRAYTAFEAIDLLRKMRFDIVITDINMPVMDGLELLGFIKRYWPSCRVIILTAYNDFQYAYNTLEYDNVDFILKIESYEVIRKKIQKHLQQIENEQNKEQFYINLGERITRMTPYLRSDAIDRILNGEDPRTNQKELDMLELPLNQKNPILLVLGLLGGKQPSEVKKRLSEISVYVERKMMLRNISVVFHTYQCYAVWLIQQCGDLINQPPEDSAAYVYEVFSELPDRLMQQTGETLTFVVDKRFVEWGQLPLSYKKAVICLERFRGESGVQMLEDTVQEELLSDEHQYPSFEELCSLWNLLKNEDKDAFISTLSERMAFLRKINDLKSALPLPAVSAVELLSLKAVHLFELDASEYMSSYRLLFSSIDLPGSQWLEMCIHLFEKIFHTRDTMKKNRSSNLIEQIKSYIEAHFTEDLSLSSLAEMFHYNPSYLSRLYKENTGETLMDYFCELRLNYAKRLLRDSRKKTSEIAKQCGFSSTKYFNQAFKKAVGMSPTSYRQELQEKV